MFKDDCELEMTLSSISPEYYIGEKVTDTRICDVDGKWLQIEEVSLGRSSLMVIFSEWATEMEIDMEQYQDICNEQGLDFIFVSLQDTFQDACEEIKKWGTEGYW